MSDQKIREIARSLEFNGEEFEKMMKNPKILAKIQQDILNGRQAGVTGTPTVFVNGRRLRDWSLNGLQMLIDKELGKSNTFRMLFKGATNFIPRMNTTVRPGY